jgi:hypothetical protein
MGYGGRLLGGYTHKEAKASIPDTAQLWFDEDGEDSPTHAPFSLVSQPNVAAGGYSPVFMAAPPQVLAGPGAADVVTHQTNVESTGVAQAVTLANGTIIGQVKIVCHNIDGGSFVMTPTSLADGTTVTFTSIHEQWTGLWNGTAWQTIALDGVTTEPVLA